jgi:hypothetical protein
MDSEDFVIKFVFVAPIQHAADASRRQSTSHDSLRGFVRSIKEEAMNRATVSFVITAFALVAGACAVQAQSAPPIKPGLWQVHSEREVNGQKVPDASDRLKNLSPERRARFEAMMKARGVESGAPGMTKMCYTSEMLKHSPWANVQTDCKATFSKQTSAEWKWHTTCPKSGYEADGEAIFTDPENYTVQSSSVSKADDKVRSSRTTITAKWLGSDCGSVPPLNPNP